MKSPPIANLQTVRVNMRALATFIILLATINLIGQDRTFEYNSQIITKYAIIALEEYNALNPRTAKNPQSEYELDNSISYGRLVTDCEGEKIRVIMVVFPNKKGDGHAAVHLTYSKDNYFAEILNREHSIQPSKEAIDGFKNSDFGDFLFGCGL